MPLEHDRQEEPDERGDEDLARAARAGSMSAFESLVYRYEKRIFLFLRQRTGNQQDAEDLTQQVFVKAYQALDRFDPARRVSPWLYTIAHRTAVSHYRAAPRPEAPVVGQDADLASPDVLMAGREEARELWQWARAQTTTDQFVALWLRIQEDMPVKDIATAMQKTRVSVKVLLHRGRRRLAAAWPPEQVGDGVRGQSTGRPDASRPQTVTPFIGLVDLTPAMCADGEKV